MPLFDTQTAAAHASIDTLAQVAEQTAAFLNQQINSLGSQLVTANQELQADAQKISDQDEKINFLNGELSDADSKLAEVRAQLTQLQSVKVYGGLEYNAWAQNWKSQVGGSGVGTAGFKPAEVTGMAKMWIRPGPRPDPTKPNYFDVYNTQDFTPLDDAITRWRMENTFIFPTQADADAANCLELEARQVLLNGNMFVAGLQLNFGNNAFRYWDHVKKWTPSGVSCPRFLAGKMYHAAVDAHRDATTIYHDAISLNDLKVPLSVSYPTWKEVNPWRQMLRCAIQLDAKDVPFEVVIGRTKFTVSN